jgi:hypothetical protein
MIFIYKLLFIRIKWDILLLCNNFLRNRISFLYCKSRISWIGRRAYSLRCICLKFMLKIYFHSIDIIFNHWWIGWIILVWLNRGIWISVSLIWKIHRLWRYRTSDKIIIWIADNRNFRNLWNHVVFIFNKWLLLSFQESTFINSVRSF